MPFLPSPLKTQKIRILKKWRKLLVISSFYTSVPKTTIMRYNSWDTEWDRHNSLSFWTNQENQNSKKIKKLSEDVIILHMFSKNHNHMMYASWDMEYDRYNFLSFWAVFCLFTPLLTPKIKIRNKCKKNLEILSYYTWVP